MLRKSVYEEVSEGLSKDISFEQHEGARDFTSLFIRTVARKQSVCAKDILFTPMGTCRSCEAQLMHFTKYIILIQG